MALDQDALTRQQRLDRRVKAIEFCLNRANEISKGATRTALIWLAVLAILWVGTIEPKMAKVQGELIGIAVHGAGHQAAQNQIGQGANVHISESSELGGERKIRLSRIVESSDRSLKELKRLRSKLEDDHVQFKIFGLEYESSLIWAPFLCGVLLLGLVMYLGHSRADMYSVCGRMIRIFREDLSQNDAELSKDLADLIAAPPWWFVPLPTRDTKYARAEEFRQLLGWTLTQNIVHGCMVAFVCLLGLVQLRVAWVAFELAWLVGSLPEQLLGSGGAFLLIGLTALHIGRWMVPATVEYYYAGDPDPNFLSWKGFGLHCFVAVLFTILGLAVLFSMHFFQSTATSVLMLVLIVILCITSITCLLLAYKFARTPVTR